MKASDMVRRLFFTIFYISRKKEKPMVYVRYIFKKLIQIVIITFIVSILVFFLLRLNPASPLSVILGGKQSTPETQEMYTKQFHLDEPLLQQYFIWLKGAVHGDFGIDYVQKQPILPQIIVRIPVTIGLVAFSMIVGIIGAMILGMVSALKRGTWVDSALSTLMLFLASMPSFVLCILVILFLSIYFPGYSFVGTYTNFKEFISRISVPGFIMSLGVMASLGRVTRSSMITQFQAPYMLTAQAKGLSLGTMTFKHAFHNAIIPVLTVTGYMAAASIGGTVLIEQIFSLPGIGGMLVTAVQGNNYPVVQVLVLVMLIVYLVMSFIVDILYVIVDPRIELK